MNVGPRLEIGVSNGARLAGVPAQSLRWLLLLPVEHGGVAGQEASHLAAHEYSAGAAVLALKRRRAEATEPIVRLVELPGKKR